MHISETADDSCTLVPDTPEDRRVLAHIVNVTVQQLRGAASYVPDLRCDDLGQVRVVVEGPLNIQNVLSTPTRSERWSVRLFGSNVQAEIVGCDPTDEG